MRVGIIQSNYVPWRGYFDFIDDVDVFIVFDDVQYTDRDWRNRNRLKTPRGLEWISVSVHQSSRDQLIQDIPINRDINWAERHLNLLRENYRDAPHYAAVSEEFSAILVRHHARLSELNLDLMTWVMARLGIKTRLVDAATLPGRGRKSERLISLVQAVGGTTYLSGPSAAAYLDPSEFERAGITVEYKSYDYEPYPQLWGTFEGAVSTLDLLINTGPEARRLFKSQSPNRRT
jgi:hypothetical protein